MGINEIQHYVHAHTFQMNFLGFLKKYQETGDSAYLDKVVGAWEDISSRQKYITGTVSVGEHYEAGHNLPNTGNVGETCATNSWTLLNNNLFELTGDAAYQQTVEDVIFNHMFATSTIEGDGYSYHRPLNGTTDRFFTGPDCCSSSGMRMQSYVPYYIYSKSDSEVYVNQFIESEVNITLENGNTIHLKQTTDYPETDEIVLEVTDASAATVLNIRVPDWVKDPAVKINGEAVDAVTAGSYIAVTVNAGDRIEITYPSELTWVEGDNSNDGLWAMKKGPMVYAIAAAFMSEEESQEAYGSDIAIVSATSVLKPEADKPVQTEEKVEFQDDRILGAGYRVIMTTSRGEQEVTVVPYANIGQWQHLAVVINGVTASLYLNGEEVGTASDFQFVPMLISNMTSNLLGKSHYTADSYFQGSMDDFRIYNRALSASEITMLSNGEEPVREIQTVSDPEDVETTAGVAPILPEKANVTYADGTNGTEPIVWEDIPEENYAQAGTFTVKGTVGTFEVEITVTVKEEEEPEEPELTELQVTAPEKTVYEIGDELDLTGLQVTAIYSDGTTKDVTSDAEISGFDSETAGEKIITVSYGELDTSFTVTVEEKEDPTEPSDPGDPSDPSDPTDPGSPSDPADPTGPADPSLPSDGGQGDGASTANPEEQTAVQTGDSLRLTPYLAALILAGTVSGIILIRKKRGEKTIRICQSELPVSKKENRG